MQLTRSQARGMMAAIRAAIQRGNVEHGEHVHVDDNSSDQEHSIDSESEHQDCECPNCTGDNIDPQIPIGPPLPDSEFLSACVVRARYGPAISDDIVRVWSDTKPMVSNVPIKPDMLVVQQNARAHIMGVPDEFHDLIMANHRLMVCVNICGTRGAYMLGLMPRDECVDVDATEEILAIWKGQSDAKVAWTPTHAIICVGRAKVILVRRYITKQRAIETWPNVYSLVDGVVKCMCHEGAVYQYLADTWLMDGKMDLRGIVCGRVIVPGLPAEYCTKMMERATERIRAISKGMVCNIGRNSNSMMVFIRPVDQDVLAQIIREKYPDFTDIEVNYSWTNPQQDQIDTIMEECQMMKISDDRWVFRPRYKHRKRADIMPLGAYSSPRDVGSQMWTVGWPELETCIRLLRFRLCPVIPRDVWNGIVRLSLYYHAGAILSRLFKTFPQDTTFQYVTTAI